MEGPVSFWGYKEQESNLILHEHDDDDDDDDDLPLILLNFMEQSPSWEADSSSAQLAENFPAFYATPKIQ